MNLVYASRVLAVAGLLAAAVLPLRALDPAKSVYQFNCRNWTRQTELPAGRINAIAQAGDGFLWLGTQGGLVRFDGLSFVPFAIDRPEARGREVRGLAASGRGDLLVTINNGAFGRFDGETFSVIDDPSWPRANVTAKTMMEARDGTVWTGSNLGIGGSVPGKPAAGCFVGTRPARVWSLCDDPAGRIWAGLDDGSVLRLVNGAPMPLADPTLANDVIYALAADSSGHVWVGGAKALRCYDGEGRPMGLPAQIMGVNALLLDRHGVLWVGTERDGLFRYADGRFDNLRAADGLVSDHVTSLCEDAEGSLWVGTRDGLSQLSDIKFPVVTEREGVPVGSAHMVVAARRGGLWIAGSHGACLFDGTKTVSVVDDSVLADHYVKQVAEAPNGDVYLTDAKLNVDVMSGGRLVARHVCRKWPEALAVDGEGVLVGMGATLMRARDGVLVPYAFAEGQDTDFQWFDHLCVARDGAIWLPAYNGVYRIKDGRTQRFAVADARPEDRLHFIMEDADGIIWVASSAGLIRIRDGKLKRITAANGLGDNHIYALAADDLGNLWLDSSRGILRVSRTSLNDFAEGRAASVACDVFEGLEAVKYSERTDQEYSGCKTADGRIWFPNVHGVVMIDPANFYTNRVAPPVRVERVVVDGKAMARRETLELPVGAGRVEFFFAAPSFVAPQKMTVRYRLEGFDEDWVEAGTKRSALYTNLGHGDYTFRVQACNSDGVWNTAGATCAFSLPPHFYETLWFHLLCGLAGLGALFVAYRWQTRRMLLRQLKLEAENDLLEAKVAERTAQLSYERDLLRTLLEHSADSIYFKDTESRFVKAGRALARSFGVDSPEKLIGRTDRDFLTETQAAHSLADEREILRTGAPILNKIESETTADGRATWVLTSKIPWRGKNGEIIGTFGVSKDISALKEAERKVDEIHRQLLETSRQAGMAEVATSVLHNVGNVLNSINVSATLVADRLRTSKVSHLPKVGAMLDAHLDDLPDFLTNDPKGRAIAPYLATLGGELVSEQGLLVLELEQLRKNIEHIKEIVAMQQSYAKISGIAESVALSEIVEDAIRINSGALNRHQVELVREYRCEPMLTIERHKVMQILVNLIRNAKYACDDSGRADKRIAIRIEQDAEAVRLSVIDNGIGIPPENLTRIFEHGFTTRKSGHGFGLHSGALTAKELGGSLTVLSEGTGRGAVFTINLPLPQPGH